YMTTVVLKLSGSPGDQATLHIYGHEAGTSFPQLEADLITPEVMTLTGSGIQEVVVDIDPPLYFDNNQFFIAVDNFSAGVELRCDNVIKTIPCESGSGGNYYYQFMYDGTNWASGGFAFAIDIVMDYDKLTSSNYLQDITSGSGIDSNLSNSTIACNDVNGDGLLDLLIRGKLYINQGNMSFIDKTSTAGINVTGSPVVNFFVDMDNDGDLDIVLLDANDTSWLFWNNGDLNFLKLRMQNLPVFKALNSMSIADLNHDKYPDLFVSQLWSTYPESEPNYLFYNNQTGDFTDETTRLYPEWDGTWNFPNAAWNPSLFIVDKNRNSRGSSWIDFDDDGDLDLFITNYFLHQDEFFENDGNGNFTDICVAKDIDRNLSGSNHGTGVDWADYDNDGDMDLLLCQFAHPGFQLQYDHRGTTIYKNEGGPDFEFTDLVGSHGIHFEETHAGGTWGDINNDGLMDIIMTVYYGCRYIDIYIQQPDHTFKLESFDAGIHEITTGQDAIWADLDEDGKLDLICGENGRIKIWKNKHSNSNSWISFDLESTSANHFAIGARVKLYAGGEVYTQEVISGRGQRMQKSHRLHFGLSNATSIDSVVIRWPNKEEIEVWTGLPLDQNHLLKEGTGGPSGFATEQDPIGFITTYPNPFTNNITFSFKTPVKGNVSLRIIDLQGREVVQLIDEEYKAGNYAIEWKSTTVPVGLYFFQLKAGEELITGKVTKLHN
ncbi:MAG: VCBS repeat-containing protein, partial [Bacteroidetes bacterium]|nr:VCBS repeat-containing protein [Bacteroidota bacterium]